MSTHLAVAAASGLRIQALQKGVGAKIAFQEVQVPVQKAQSISQLLKRVDEYARLQQTATQLCTRFERVTLEYLPSEFRRVGSQELRDFLMSQVAQLDVEALESIEEATQKLQEAQQQFQKLQTDLQSVEQQFNQ